MTTELKATKRSVTGKGVQALRKEGRMPAVVYGAKEQSLPIEVSMKDFHKVFKEAGEASVISLTMDGEKKNVLIHDVDLDPITNEPRHADLYAITKGQKVEVEVPLVFIGESPAVKELGANLIRVLHEIEVKGEATHLPHEVTVDISGLKTLDDYIAAKDVALPQGVELVTNPEEAVATLAMPEEEPEEPVAAPDIGSIGISEERGKKEGEGEDQEKKPAETAP